jgi:alkylhydroperoxidase family enzyme
MLAHGAVLRKNFFSADELIAIVKDFRNAGLSPEEVAIMSFVQKVTTSTREITDSDVEELRSFGLSDDEIFDVVLACTARNFFSKTLDSINVTPDEKYLELEPELLQQLTIGRPFPNGIVDS